MRHLIILCLTLLLFSSCRTKTVVVREIEYRTDSIAVTDTIVDVRLDVVKDSVVSDTSFSFLCNRYAYSYARFDGQKLHHSLGIYDGLVPIHISFPKQYITVTRTKEAPVYIDKPLSKWQKIKMKIGEIAIGTAFALAITIFYAFIMWKK